MTVLLGFQKAICIIVLLFTSLLSYAGGVAERKNESREHRTFSEHTPYRLSLDDVMPEKQSVLVQNSSSLTQAKPEPLLVRVTGYSAYETVEDAKSEVKRLKAQRASKLDAYRALAERVYGLSIKGQSSMKDHGLQEDHFAIGFDSYIRGARVVSVNEKKGKGFETVLELTLPGNFDDCLNKVGQFKNGLNCVRPLPNSALYLEGGNHKNPSRASHSARYEGSKYFIQ